MITRAVVEKIISPTQVKVRIPIFDGASSSTLSTNVEDLTTATICSLPNCYMNIQQGDIVFVGFEDNTYYQAVILGCMNLEALTNSVSDMTLGRLSAKHSATLPSETTIGDLTSEEIFCLSGVKENLQSQLDALDSRLRSVENALSS